MSTKLGREGDECLIGEQPPTRSEPDGITCDLDEALVPGFLYGSGMAHERVLPEFRGERRSAESGDPPQAERDRLEGACLVIELLSALDRSFAGLDCGQVAFLLQTQYELGLGVLLRVPSCPAHDPHYRPSDAGADTGAQVPAR
mgnify:CR=1 FL=1